MFLKVHVSKDSTVPDHCQAYALSYPQDDNYITVCDHEHNARCDRCELLPTIFHEIQSVLGSVDCSVEDREEMEYEISQSRQSIQAWKAHLLRAINQDAARHEILENLDAQSVFIVMDWAMKFLPRKFRESQSDWFGKRGIPWHISVAMRKKSNSDETEMLTFVHSFESCSQDSSTVLAIIDDVFIQLKEIMPEINSVYLRQDNAGCYHCASTLLSVHQVATKHGINLKRVDFSDPQGGKGSCDRKAATIKSHMRIHLNSGHDIESASDIMTAIESSGEMAGVSVTVSGPQPTSKSTPVKWEGVSFINNIAYTNEGMQVWRAYGVGSGKFLPRSSFRQQPSVLPQLNKCADNANSASVCFQTVKARRKAKQRKASPTEDDLSDDEGCEKESKLFFCPEEGCVKSFQQYSSLEKHLDCDKHKYALEHETLYDKAMVMYATKLEHGAGPVPQIDDEDIRISLEDDDSDDPALPMGWALKSASITRKNLTVAQKNYLTELFQAGERTGQKADATSVSKAMRRAKHSDGSNIFDKGNFLTPQQIAGFFSRLAAKKTYSTDKPGDVGDEEVERHEPNTEKNIQDLTDEVMTTFALQHPIMFDKYNICEIMFQPSKLSKFTIEMLREICTALELDISSITITRRQPYIDILQELVGRCDCKSSK